VVELEHDEVFTGRPRVGAEEVNARLLAMLERFQVRFDEAFVEEMLERFASQRDAPSGRVRNVRTASRREREPKARRDRRDAA
jgi:hypothetical protein